MPAPRPTGIGAVREGFATDRPGEHRPRRRHWTQANYCIWCHREQGKDSCSRGLRLTDAKSPSERQANYCIWCHEQGKDLQEERPSFGVTLAGCPLEERISEFHKLKTRG
jgi:hypothetical protein